MNYTSIVKTILLNIFGGKVTSFFQAIRFVYLIKSQPAHDLEIVLLDKFVFKGDIAIDVCSNGADWTYYLHKRVSPSGMVYAFEADPYYAKSTSLAIKILSLSRVKLFSFGLSDKAEKVYLRTLDKDGVRYAGRSFIDKNAWPSEKGVEVIHLKSLDSMASDYPEFERVNFIKCDVEGFELFVFEGAKEVLAKARPIVVLEVAADNMRGYTPKDLHRFFTDLDFVSFAATQKGELFRTNDCFEAPEINSINRVLIPKEKISNFSKILLD